MSHKTKMIEQMNDFDKLSIYHGVVQALNQQIRKDYDPKFIGFEPLITVTIAVNSGEILPYLLSFKDGVSLVSASLEDKLTEGQNYDLKSKGKTINMVKSKMSPNPSTLDEVLFLSSMMIFVNCIYPISFLDLIPVKASNVKDDFTFSYLSSIEDKLTNIEMWQLTNLLGFLRENLPKNKDTINFVSGIISELSLENPDEALLDTSTFDLGEDIFNSARKKL